MIDKTEKLMLLEDFGKLRLARLEYVLLEAAHFMALTEAEINKIKSLVNILQTTNCYGMVLNKLGDEYFYHLGNLSKTLNVDLESRCDTEDNKKILVEMLNQLHENLEKIQELVKSAEEERKLLNHNFSKYKKLQKIYNEYLDKSIFEFNEVKSK